MMWSYLWALIIQPKKMRKEQAKICKSVIYTLFLTLMPSLLWGQQILTLEQCRTMAAQNDKGIEQAQTKVIMAGYDRKIALANFFPNIVATGTYTYNDHNISLINSDMSNQLTTMGTTVQGRINDYRNELIQQITSNPLASIEYMLSPMWQTVLGSLSDIDVEDALNAIGTEIDEAFHLDIQHIFTASVTLQQPVFMGGKIVAANQMAKLAEELAQTQYEQQYRETTHKVDETYWQIVSISAKRELAENYDSLLHKMQRDVEIAVQEGVATEADALSIKVKVNEADMMLTKATNGLALCKMLLCKQIGLPLNADIVLVDEADKRIPVPYTADELPDMEQVYANRTEIRSLNLASQIYKKKVAMARADMMPKIALTGGYMMTNRDMRNGFEKKWSGLFNVGVIVNVPIFHGGEALFKMKKAKYEATLYQSQCEDAKNMIALQVTQLQKQVTEMQEKVRQAEDNLTSAEENLRTATIGFQEGVIPANTALAAQTAWLQAHTEYIDAGVELQIAAANLQRAIGQ